MCIPQVKRLLAVDSIKVEETQMNVWNGSSSFTISSATKVTNVSAANRFTTKLCLTCSSRPPSSSSGSLGEAVDLHFSVEVAAGVVWPLSSSIENVMAEQATNSMTQWVDFACRAVEEALATTPPATPKPSSGVTETDDQINRVQSSVLLPSPSPSINRTGSVRRWPTAIVSRSSSSFPSLVGNEEGGREDGFLDASEAFATPASSLNRSRFGALASDLITPLLEEREERDIEEGQLRDEGNGALIHTRDVDSNQMVAAALRSLSSEIRALRTMVESLQQSEPLPPFSEAAAAPSASFRRALFGGCFCFLLIVAIWHIYYPYRTGLILPPPSPPS